MTHDEMKQQLIWAGRVLVAEGQDDFTRGPISFRLPDNPSRFFMKPHSLRWSSTQSMLAPLYRPFSRPPSRSISRKRFAPRFC
jgi:hypothetical protein